MGKANVQIKYTVSTFDFQSSMPHNAACITIPDAPHMCVQGLRNEVSRHSWANATHDKGFSQNKRAKLR